MGLLAAALAVPARADPGPAPLTPYAECETAIASATLPPARVPANLLPAIARVESGRLDPRTSRVRPWPWTINVDGVGSYFDSKEQAVATVAALQAKGVKSVDVGCMQVNLMHHPHAFSGLDDAFDPASNARYAVTFLTALYGQTKNWNLATAMYHSAEPERGEDYQRRVFGRVMTPMGARVVRGTYTSWPPPGVTFGAFPPVGLAYGALTAPTSGGFGLPPRNAFPGLTAPTTQIGSVPFGRPARR